MVSYFLTHAEVDVEPSDPIECWGLSATGRSRAAAAHRIAWDPAVARIVSSEERKAVETATLLGAAVSRTPSTDPLLGEIDRSATGYLVPSEFEPVVDAFFARPTESVRGWERAVDAQARIVAAVRALTGDGSDVTVVSHGAVGALLLADLLGEPISRALDQPGMGSVFTFDPRSWRARSPWSRVQP